MELEVITLKSGHQAVLEDLKRQHDRALENLQHLLNTTAVENLQNGKNN